MLRVASRRRAELDDDGRTGDGEYGERQHGKYEQWKGEASQVRPHERSSLCHRRHRQ